MKAIVLVAIAAMCAVSALADDFCTYVVDEKKYDLSSLGHTPGDREKLFHMLQDTSVVTANLCGATSLICPDGTSVCLRTTGYTYASRGDANSMKIESFKDDKDFGLVATFTTKEACGNSHYTTKVRLVCADVKENQVVSVTGDDKACDLELVVKTQAACGDVEPSSSAQPSSSAASTLIPSLALVVLALVALF